MPKLLLVTYDFPPSNRVAVHRSLSNAFYLRQLGWDVKILTVKSKCYDIVDENLFFPESLENETIRNAAVNGMKIGFYGKYIDFFAIPDEWISWLFSGTVSGLRILRNYDPDIVWSTCPPFTTHLVAGLIARLGKLPWVADYRDPITDQGRGVIGQSWAIRKTDKFVAKNATRLTFATSESRDLYSKRYSDMDVQKFQVVNNGYYDLPDIDRSTFERQPSSPGLFTILYSGSVYGHRDPSPMFFALSELKKSGVINRKNFSLNFQGAGFGEAFFDLVTKYGIADVIAISPPVGFEESIRAMRSASALLLIQGKGFNLQIPAKAYEYIAAQRPIIGLCPAEGATAKLLESVPYAYVEDQTENLIGLLENLLNESCVNLDRFDFSEYSRFSSAKKLDGILKGCLSE